MSGELRLVFDTNTLISALLIADSKPREAFSKALDEGKLLLSPAVLDELNEVLRRPKLRPYIAPQERAWLWRELIGNGIFVEAIVEEIAECRDPRDNKFLELAISGKADAIVTGDADLLALNPFRGIPILSSADFLCHSFS
jgi:putative PIN family toxin of toxin-antitoxin system